MRGPTSSKEEETFDIKNIPCAGGRHGASCPEKSKMLCGNIFHDTRWELDLTQSAVKSRVWAELGLP